jgi:hypothetical protein
LNDRQTDSVSLVAGLLIIVIAALFVGVFGLVLLVSGLIDKR